MKPAPWGELPFVKTLLDEYEWVPIRIDADVAFVDLEADIAAEQEPDEDSLPG